MQAWLACSLLVLGLSTEDVGESPGVISVVVPSSDKVDSKVRVDDDLKYVIGVLSDKIVKLPKAAMKGGRHIVMTSKTGKKYNCTIPDPSSATDPDDDEEEEEVRNHASSLSPQDLEPSKKVQQQKVSLEKAKADQAASLKQTFGKGCVSKIVGYWTYEVCPFRRVRQFHQEGEKITMEFSLGSYEKKKGGDSPAQATDTATTTTTTTTTTATTTTETTPLPDPLTQKFVGGTDGRESALRFVCDRYPNTAAPHVLTTIHEPRVRQYEFELTTPLACLDEAIFPSSFSTSSTLGKVKSAPATPVVVVNKHTKPIDILKPLENQCAFLTTGWWTYKYCFLNDVSQFHVEATPVEGGKQGEVTKKVTVEFSLGKFSSTSTSTSPSLPGTGDSNSNPNSNSNSNPAPTETPDATVEALNQALTLVWAEQWQDSYVSHWVDDGTLCDLTGKPRRTEVRFHCAPEEAFGVNGIKETSTCEYLLTVHTKLLCVHPAFKAKQAKVHEIVCRPLATPPRP